MIHVKWLAKCLAHQILLITFIIILLFMLSKNNWHSLYYLCSLLPTIHFLQPILILVTQSQNYGYFLLTKLCFPPGYLTLFPQISSSGDEKVLKLTMVMVALICKYNKSHSAGHFKGWTAQKMNLYHNKVIFKNLYS